MAPIITIFNFDENVCAQAVKTLDPYYSCFVDGKTLLEDVNTVYNKPNGRFFGFADKLTMIDPRDLEFFDPAFCVHLDEEVGVKDWLLIFKFFQYIFGENDEASIVDTMSTYFPQEKQNPLPINPPIDATKPRPYELKCEKISQIDTVLYEVKRPNGDVYTTVINNFSKNGMLPLFTNLFICNSWGNLAADREFLKVLWDQEMKEEFGEFDLNQLLKDATKACYPDENNTPAVEPKVYRKNLVTVKKMLHRKMGIN